MMMILQTRIMIKYFQRLKRGQNFREGRVLGELATGPHLIDLAVDAKLNLYVLKEPGILQCVSPGATLAVVG